MVEATNGIFETLQIASLDRIEKDLLFHLEVVGFLLLLEYQILVMFLFPVWTSAAIWAWAHLALAFATLTEVTWAALIFVDYFYCSLIIIGGILRAHHVFIIILIIFVLFF